MILSWWSLGICTIFKGELYFVLIVPSVNVADVPRIQIKALKTFIWLGSEQKNNNKSESKKVKNETSM